jgi:hypothetical protein
MVKNIAGKDALCAMGNFDSHYKPDGMPAGDAFQSSFDLIVTLYIIVIMNIMFII